MTTFVYEFEVDFRNPDGEVVTQGLTVRTFEGVAAAFREAVRAAAAHPLMPCLRAVTLTNQREED